MTNRRKRTRRWLIVCYRHRTSANGCANDSCGKGSIHGSCEPLPFNCPSFPDYEACGCDGAIYDSECAAQANGVDVSRFACGTLPGHYHCGPYYCDWAETHCRCSSRQRRLRPAVLPVRSCRRHHRSRISLYSRPTRRRHPAEMMTNRRGFRGIAGLNCPLPRPARR